MKNRTISNAKKKQMIYVLARDFVVVVVIVSNDFDRVLSRPMIGNIMYDACSTYIMYAFKFLC